MMGCSLPPSPICWASERVPEAACAAWRGFASGDLPAVVEALVSIAGTESLLVAAGRQLRGRAVQLPLDLGWRWGVQDYWNEREEEEEEDTVTVCSRVSTITDSDPAREQAMGAASPGEHPLRC